MTAIRILLSLISLFALAPGVSAHRYHTSVTRLEYNSEKRLIEITVQTFADDIEATLSKRNGRRLQLDSSAKTNALLLEYLRSVIALKKGDTELELKWIGMELKGHSAWFYLEAEAPGGLADASLRNNLMFDLFTDQVNIVNVFNSGKRNSLVFKRGDTAKAIP